MEHFHFRGILNSPAILNIRLSSSQEICLS